MVQPQEQSVQVLLNGLRSSDVQAALNASTFCVDAEPVGSQSSTTNVFLENFPDVVDGLESEPCQVTYSLRVAASCGRARTPRQLFYGKV